MTLTGRLSQSQPEMQHLGRRRLRPVTLVTVNFADIEARVMAFVKMKGSTPSTEQSVQDFYNGDKAR